MSDHDQLMAAIDDHRASGDPISDAAARMIAAAYHGGQASVGYSFASTGAINGEQLLHTLFTGTDPAESDGARAALQHYLDYRLRRGETGPVPEWSTLWLEGARTAIPA